MLRNGDLLDILNRLNRFSSSFTIIHTLDELAAEVEAVLDDIIEIEFSGLYLYDFKEQKLKLLFAKGFNEEEKREAERTAMERHPGHVFRTKQILNIPDTENDPEHRSISSARSFVVRSRLFIPVMNGSQPVGAFGLVSSEKNHFDEMSVAILSFICNIAGGIYGNILTQAELRKTSLIARETDNSVIITDKYGNTEWVNRGFEVITGYTAREITGIRPGVLLQGPDTDPESVARISEALEKRIPIELDLINYHKSGRKYWLRVQIQPVFDEHGELTHFIAIQRDITEQKKAQEEIETVSIRLTTLIKNIHAGILAEDQHRKIVLVNKTFCELFGIPVEPELLMGSDCSDSAEQSKHLFRDPEQFVTRISRMLEEKKPVLNEELELSDGRVFERDYVPIFANEKFLGNLWRYSDITDRKASERQIIRLQKFFEQVLDDLPGHIAVFDTDLRYLYVNPAGVRDPELRKWVIGKTDEEFCLFAGIDPEVGIRRREVLTRVLNEKKQLGFEECITRKSGEQRYFQRWIHPVLNEEGAVLQLIGYGIDVTDRHRYQEELIEARRVAENSTRAKDLFLAQMSHEIRTPLNAVIGLAKLIRETDLSPQQEELIGNLLISAENLLAIISEILDFSKIEAGRIELESVPFTLPEVMKRVHSFQEQAASKKGIILKIAADDNIPKALLGDPVRLQQVLINLVSNAVKFTHQGWVGVGCELSGISGGTATVLFSVTDTGIGISKENLENIFERFQQEDASVTRLYGGTGLGLPISRQLVNLMGGELKVESRKGEGSRFFFSIPFPVVDQSVLEADRNKPVTDARILEGKRILIVEDNAFNQFIVKAFIEKWGGSVDIAENGKIAITLMQEKEFHLVLMDLQMPVMDGLTATRMIRNELKQQMPVIALTANVTKEAIDQAFEAGMNEYISKPFDEDDLYLKVVTAVGKKPEFLRKKPVSGQGLKGDKPSGNQ